jgi:hypothetical protein
MPKIKKLEKEKRMSTNNINDYPPDDSVNGSKAGLGYLVVLVWEIAFVAFLAIRIISSLLKGEM